MKYWLSLNILVVVAAALLLVFFSNAISLALHQIVMSAAIALVLAIAIAVYLLIVRGARDGKD